MILGNKAQVIGAGQTICTAKLSVGKKPEVKERRLKSGNLIDFKIHKSRLMI